MYRLHGRSIGFFQQRKGLKLNNEKEYVQFLEDIKEQVEAFFDGKVKGEVCTSVKNNGVNVTGLLLKGEEERVAPNFYLERQFGDWLKGLCSLEEIVENLCKTYQEEVQKSSHLLSKIKFDWEFFRRGVFMRLVNKEKNKDLLENIPYQEFLDLAVVYYYSLTISGDVLGTLIITREHLEILNITEEELHQAAKSNCQRFQPVKVRCMEDLIYDLGRKIGVDVCEARACHPFLFVMTNARGMFGAVSMVFSEELESFSKRVGKGFYILPSSVHEIILVPEYSGFDLEYFSAMVHDINETQVEDTEILSDSIYYYDIEAKSIKRVA